MTATDEVRPSYIHTRTTPSARVLFTAYCPYYSTYKYGYMRAYTDVLHHQLYWLKYCIHTTSASIVKTNKINEIEWLDSMIGELEPALFTRRSEDKLTKIIRSRFRFSAVCTRAYDTLVRACFSYLLLHLELVPTNFQKPYLRTRI